MTIDERIERLEHIVAGHIEQARKDYEENRRLWREQQIEITAIWKRMEYRDQEWDRKMAEMRETMASRDRDRDREWDRKMGEVRETMAGRDQTIDKRIADLVTAIGELIRKMP